MAGLTKGTRVSYRLRNEIRHGVVVGIDTGTIAGTYYIVRNSASGLRHAVLPQYITAVY